MAERQGFTRRVREWWTTAVALMAVAGIGWTANGRLGAMSTLPDTMDAVKVRLGTVEAQADTALQLAKDGRDGLQTVDSIMETVRRMDRVLCLQAKRDHLSEEVIEDCASR